MTVTFITQFTRDCDSIRDCNVVEFKKPSMVKESLSYATDINTIYENYCKTGKLPLNGQQPIYDENFERFDSIIDASKKVEEVTKYFQSLPTEIKNQYGNSLSSFIKGIQNNDSFLYDKGVLVKSEKPSVEKPSLDVSGPSDSVLTVESVESVKQLQTSEMAVQQPVNTVKSDVL